MNNDLRAIIFDLDGTLLDTLQDLANAANDALTQFGYPEHRVDGYRQFIGDGARMLISRAMPADVEDSKITEKCQPWRIVKAE